MEPNGGHARGAGHASSSSRPQRSSSPIRPDNRGFRAVCSNVQRKLGEFYTFDLMPKTFIVKFRQRVEGLQLGANFEVSSQIPLCLILLPRGCCRSLFSIIFRVLLRSCLSTLA